jgi:hypothetical protein
MPLHSVGVQLVGEKEFVAAIRKVNRDLPKHMSKAMKAIAVHVVGKARGKMEFGDGPAAQSLKPHGTTKGAYISFPGGGPTARGDKAGEYPWLDFGGGKTGVRGITSSTGASHQAATDSRGHRLDRGSGFKRPVIIGGRYLYPAISESGPYISDAVDKEMKYLIVAAGFDTEGHV